MPNTDLPPQEEYAYSMPPAATISLNINLTSLPKCPHCTDGVWLPFQSTTNPRSSVNSVIVNTWACNGCDTNIVYEKGQLTRQIISALRTL
jgi:hypothetical protein